MLHVDLFYLPKTAKNPYKGVLLIVDSFTKFIEARMIKIVNSQQVWKKFEDEILYRYGAPQVVISDNGPEFTHNFHANLEARHIKHIYTTPHNPQSNG